MLAARENMIMRAKNMCNGPQPQMELHGSGIWHPIANIILYPREKGAYGPRLGDGPIFKESVSQLYMNEYPGKLSVILILISVLFKHSYQLRARTASYWADTASCAVDGSCIEWVWL